MSVRCKRSGLLIAWSRTMTVLSPWRRGIKADSVVDGEVVLTKVKVFSRSQRNLLSPVVSTDAKDSPDPNQAASTEPDAESSTLDPGLWGRPEDSEDSGLDSPSSPLRSHNSLVLNSLVHSRGSSCDSGNSDQTEAQSQNKDDTDCYQNTSKGYSDQAVFAGEGAGLKDGGEDSQGSEKSPDHHGDGTEEFMEECCRLQARSLSGLGYLDQVCRLVERISRLQDLVLHLQRELRTQRPEQSLDPSLDRHKLDFLLHYCTCGAADRLLQVQTQSPTKSPSRTDPEPDLKSIPECPPRLYSCRESAPCRRRRSRHSLTDGNSSWSKDKLLHRELSERSSSSWSRIQDLVKTRSRSKARLRAGSFKTSCPQLHRPDPGSERVQTRSSMILVDQRPDWPWLH